MTKTPMEIEEDIYHLVRDSALAAEIDGSVCRGKTRPYGSKDEDAVVTFLSGRDDQIQEGVVILNIYTRDITAQTGQSLADTKRIAVLQRLVLDLIENSRGGDYRLETDGSMTTLEAADINQHYINARIRYKYYSD